MLSAYHIIRHSTTAALLCCCAALVYTSMHTLDTYNSYCAAVAACGCTQIEVHQVRTSY